MAFWSKFLPFSGASASPRAAFQDAGGGTIITTPEQLEEVMRGGAMTAGGVGVTAETSLRVAAVYACVRIRCGVVANWPLQIKRRVDDRTRENASDHPLWKIFNRKPNRWQTPSQFKRMLQAQLILRGNGYAMIVWSRNNVLELVPLHPDRVRTTQNADYSLSYEYTRKDGGKVMLRQDEVFHLVGLTLDGINGVTPITYARETIGMALAMENHGATVFKNGARVSIVLKHPKHLGTEGLEFLRASLDAYRAGGESEGRALILEEGMDTQPLAMTSEDAQWIESRRFTRTEIAMFMGVPPHMIGDTDKSTSFGTGLEQQTQGFITFSAEDDLVMWEETINLRLVRNDEPDIYARYNRAAMVRGDIKTRFEAYMKGRQMEVYSANDVLAMEDQNPHEGGDVYANPLITVKGAGEGENDEPEKTS